MGKIDRGSAAISVPDVSYAAAEPPVIADGPGASATSPGKILAIVCVSQFLANLDLFIVNVGLPNIARELQSTNLEELSWILNGYAIAYAALLIFFGRLAERYRRNASFLLGVAIFTAASAACSLANNVETLVAFRVVQAAGAAIMTPTSLGLLLATFPPERRGSAVRLWMSIGGASAALGPVVGGLLVTASWRWIFMVNVPIGVMALLVGWWMLPDVPGHKISRPDPWAAVFVTIGIGALTLGIVKFNDWGWNSLDFGLCAAAAVIFLALFVSHCVRSDNPFIDPALFRIRAFTGAVLAIAPFSTAFGALLLSIVLWEQIEWGWSAFETGLVIAPGPLLVPIISMLLAGRLIARFGAASVVAAGLVFFAAGMIWLALVPGITPSIPYAIVAMVMIGIGVGLAMPTMMSVGTSSLPPSSFATGSGVVNMIRQAFIAIGVAMFVAIIGSPGSPAERLVAFQHAWWIMTGVCALGLIPALSLIRTKRAS